MDERHDKAAVRQTSTRRAGQVWFDQTVKGSSRVNRPFREVTLCVEPGSDTGFQLTQKLILPPRRMVPDKVSVLS